MHSQVVTREEVRSMVTEAVERLQAKLNLQEVNKKSMTLKIKANRSKADSSNQFWESGEDQEAKA